MTEQSDMARRPMVNLDGRTAIITGSGKGIGAAVAKCLASHGAAVVINYVHDAASAQRTVEDIHSLGGLAIAVQADVAMIAIFQASGPLSTRSRRGHH